MIDVHLTSVQAALRCRILHPRKKMLSTLNKSWHKIKVLVQVKESCWPVSWSDTKQVKESWWPVSWTDTNQVKESWWPVSWSDTNQVKESWWPVSWSDTTQVKTYCTMRYSIQAMFRYTPWKAISKEQIRTLHNFVCVKKKTRAKWTLHMVTLFLSTTDKTKQ